MIYNFNKYCEKYKSRFETIINLYKELFNRNESIGDYITLCAKQVNNNKLDEGSELFQLLNHKFITEDQFYGIDIDSDVINLNRLCGIGNWYKDDIYDFLCKNINKLKPSIINLDTVLYSKRKAANLLSDVLLLLSDNSDSECLVTLNVMVNNCYETHSVTDDIINNEELSLMNELNANYSYSCALRSGWNMLDRCYLYSSTNKTVMCTYIFYRK